MSRPRSFDHDRARELYATGEYTQTQLAELFGVTQVAISYATNPDVQARARAWQRAHRTPCDSCGAPMHGRYRPHVRHCKQCADRLLATSVREHELRCWKCGLWKPDDDFPRTRAGRKLRRGRHQSCRACQAVLRREYRERHKVACERCGRPCLPPSEKGACGRDRALCLACYRTRKEWEVAA